MTHSIHHFKLAALAACIVHAGSATAQRQPDHGSFANVSPDGRYVLFSRDSGGRPYQYVMNADGSSQRVIPGEFRVMSWFPDNKRLLVGLRPQTRSDPIRLASVNLDGTGLKEIPTGSARIMGGAQLLGDGKAILFPDLVLNDAGRLIDNGGLNLMNLDGLSLRRILMPALSGRLLGAPIGSPNGHQIAFVVVDTTDHTSYTRSTTLFVMDIDGSNHREVATLPNLLEQITWSPDGRMIALSHTGRTPPIGTPMPPGHVPDANLEIIEVATGVIRPIRHPDRKYIDELPSWSSNGYIYFSSNRDGVMEIYRMKPDGSGQERLTRAAQ